MFSPSNMSFPLPSAKRISKQASTAARGMLQSFLEGYHVTMMRVAMLIRQRFQGHEGGVFARPARSS